MVHAEHQDLGPTEVVGRDQDDGDDGGRRNLTPWRKGDPRAAEAGRKGAETKRLRAEARRRENLAADVALRELANTWSRDQLGPAAVAAALHMMGEVVAGRQRVRDPASWVRVLVDVARLEAGEVTAASAHVVVTRDDVDRAIALRDAARAALPSGDGPSSQ